MSRKNGLTPNNKQLELDITENYSAWEQLHYYISTQNKPNKNFHRLVYTLYWIFLSK